MHSCEEQSDLPDNHADSGPVIPKPNLEFEDGTHSIFMIIQKFPFPVVVLCDTTKCPIPVDRSRFSFDLSQPLLFYRKRSIQKIPARTLFVDDNDQYQEAGDPLLIPEDYKGYFAILKRRTHAGPTDNNAPHYTKIEDIAQSDTEKFLIGGQNRVKAFQVTNQKEGDQSHYEQQRMLFPGDVLRKIRMFTSETKKKSKYLRRSSLITEKFLLCMDEADREVVIPFAQAGLFYSLTTTSGKGTCPVMQMSEIVASKYLPCVVKLVYGRVPTTPCIFSGLLQLDQGYLEQSIVAATIMNKKNILVEIPSTCKMEFRVAHTNDDLISHQGYQNAVQVCREKIHSYMRNIKVCLSWKSEDSLHGAGSTGSITIGDRVSQLPAEAEILDLPTPCSKDMNRDSGYIKMTPSTDDLSSQTDDSVDDGQDTYVKMSLTSPTSPPADYVLKLFLENKFLEVPVYSHDANQTEDVDDTVNSDTLKATANKSQHITAPPDLPPPPVPCPGTPPSLCGGSPSQDSGISDVGLTDTRRPSTFIFAESEQNPDDDITYDIPQIPTRRVSAPPNFDTMPLISDSNLGAIPKSSPFNKRKSKSNKNRVSSAPSEMLNKDGRLMSPTETIHEHDFPTENPRYENIEGMKEIQEKLIQLQNVTESIIAGDDSTPSCFSWYLGSPDSPEYYNKPHSPSSPPGDGDSLNLSPSYVSPSALEESDLDTPPTKCSGSSCGSTLSDTLDSVFEASPCHSGPHNNIELIHDAMDKKVDSKEDDDNVYDVIPDIPGCDSYPPCGMVKMSDKDYVDLMNSDLVELEQPPAPHHSQSVTHTYANCGTEDVETSEGGSDGVTVAIEPVDNDSDTTVVLDDVTDRIDGGIKTSSGDHDPLTEFSDAVFVQGNESEKALEDTEKQEISNNEMNDNTDQPNITDGTENAYNTEEINLNSIEYVDQEPHTKQENILSDDKLSEDRIEEPCSENKFGEEESQCQDKEGEDHYQYTLHCNEDIRVDAIEGQNPESNQNRRESVSDSLELPSQYDSNTGLSTQSKPSPPPVSPKPVRTYSEKTDMVSETVSGNILTNSEESGNVDIIDDQPVHYQLKHCKRTESNCITMSPELFEQELRDVGVTTKARNSITDRNISIEELLNMDVDNLQKDLPGVGFLDLKRIAMFIRNILTRSTGH
ncbi:uncharacterized protein LOC110448782 [Mizuhopecten yessoensis]|uniref:uncharacterized protein LOC110448782 n=1 Tax=Mizuhopecten yessoensis TaxID=6573 RepID=UPI000B458A7D|nr:uncharacterized protein LOC110448782 [Mizuhopecten yessoensis]